MNAAKALETINAYNAAVMTDVPFDPNVKDGRGTQRPRDPQVELGQHHRYAAVRGLRGDLRPHLHLRRPQDRHVSARVLDTEGAVIPGLYAAGELVGGLFYFNYPGGTGLMNGAVFGRIAGTSAGQRAAQQP